MKPNDFVYTQIYRGALAKGAKERDAQANAQIGLEEYKKGKFKKVGKLIELRIKEALN